MTGREADSDAFEGLMINADASLVAELRAEVERLSLENEGLRTALTTAAGRLTWAANADPGVRDPKGRKLVLEFADEAHAIAAAASVQVQTEK
jgi:hypothetical protein